MSENECTEIQPKLSIKLDFLYSFQKHAADQRLLEQLFKVSSVKKSVLAKGVVFDGRFASCILFQIHGIKQNSNVSEKNT